MIIEDYESKKLVNAIEKFYGKSSFVRPKDEKTFVVYKGNEKFLLILDEKLEMLFVYEILEYRFVKKSVLITSERIGNLCNFLDIQAPHDEWSLSMANVQHVSYDTKRELF